WTSPTLRYAGSFTYGTYRQMQAAMPEANLACAWRLRSSMAEWGPVAFQLVTGSYFRTIGIKPALGRLIDTEDDLPGNPAPVAAISYRVWLRAYGGSRDVLNQRLTIAGRPLQIIGVMPEGFAGLWPLEPRDVMIPYDAGSMFPQFVPPRDPNLWS